MFIPSFGFMAIAGGMLTVVGFGAGMKVTSDHYMAKEAERPVAVARVIREIKVKDDKQLNVFRGRLNNLSNLNDQLHRELEYARSQNTGSCTLGPSFVLVWDAKLAGRPVGVPVAPGGVPDAVGAVRTAVPDDLLENHARNVPRLLKDREKLSGLREWACRVHKVCPK